MKNKEQNQNAKRRRPSMDHMATQNPDVIFPLEENPGYYLVITPKSFTTYCHTVEDHNVTVPIGLSVVTTYKDTRETVIAEFQLKAKGIPYGKPRVSMYVGGKLRRYQLDKLATEIAPEQYGNLLVALDKMTPEALEEQHTISQAALAAAKMAKLVRIEENKIKIREEVEQIEKRRWTGTLEEFNMLVAARRSAERNAIERKRRNLDQNTRNLLKKVL